MKKLITISIVLFSLNSISQTDNITKLHRHELGADITGLLSQFFNLNSSNIAYNVPQPTYLLTYRYYVKKSNIRCGVGGYYDKSSVPGYTINGQEKTFYNTVNQFAFRIGYEFISNLSKKWQAFYGLDFRPSFSKQTNEAWFSNAGYLNGLVNNTTQYGFAPLLGFRFRLNDRVSLTTESSFTYNIQENKRKTTYTSLDNNLYPTILDSQTRKTKNISASFSQPIFLVLTVNL